MGFFDKIKRAFTGEPEEIKEEIKDELVKEETGISEESEKKSTGNSESVEKQIEVIEKMTQSTTTSIEPFEEISGTTSDQPTEDVSKQEEELIAIDEEQILPVERVEESEEQLHVPEKLEQGLAKTRKTFGERLNSLFANFRSVDEDFFEELEETLIGADVGFDTAMRISEALRQEVKLRNAKKPAALQNAIIEKLVTIYEEEGQDEINEINLQKDGLTVILFVGVNGVGKTTSIGKLAHQYQQEGKKVLLAAADTFRAGAIDQLVVWGERAGVDVVRGQANGDPAAVVFDAMTRAKEENVDVLLVDTAGRLQNKVNLMNELDKIKRIIQREEPNAPHEVLLVLDATTGQNAMNQAKQFKETTDVTGLVLTKLDGTAKGGIVLAIRNELHLPVKLVGLGEGINDLEPFNPTDFVVSLFKGLLKIED